MDLKIELIHLKEEVFKELRDLETKFLNMYHKKNEDIENKNKNSLDKIEIMMKKSEQMFNSINNQQLKLDKIGELELSKNKMNGMIVSHECRINSISKDIREEEFIDYTLHFENKGLVFPIGKFEVDNTNKMIILKSGDMNDRKT